MFNHRSPALMGYPQSPTFQHSKLSVLNWLNGLEEDNIIELEAIFNIAADICRTPIILIGLIGQQGFYYKSAFKVNSNDSKLADQICREVIQANSPVEFIETDLDSEEPIYCAGIPLNTAEGKLSGVLCVINYGHHILFENEKTALENLAKLTSSLLENRSSAIREETQLRFLEENTSLEMYLISSVDHSILFANKTALKSLGYPPNHLLDGDISKILVTKHPEEFRQRLNNLELGKETSFSTFAEQINSKNSRVPVKLFVSYVREGFDSSILIISRNLSNAGFESDFINYLSNYDSITGLANRRLFENLLSEKIHTSVDTPDESGLLLIDLENFKLINQSFGFSAGDNIVRQVSKLLVDFLGSDEILVRTSQDSFCVLLPNCNETQIKQKAVQIIDLVSNQDFSENGKKFRLQINIGAVLINPENSQNTDYLSLAHQAGEIAKEFGQNQFYLADFRDPLFIQRTIDIEQLINVQDAIERNKLQLYGQKIGRIGANAEKFEEHFEILIRMLNENGQTVPPIAFIPQLEKHGSIVSLDKWVLRESLKLIEERHKTLQNRQTSSGYLYNINLSARTISATCFISYCTELLLDYAHLAPYICFEITETVAISNFKTVQEFIRIIRRFGCKFALDDFGSGGASMECLKELSIDFVKIDGLFVSDIVENPVSQVIVESICKVANLLKVRVIAEKVETQEIEDALVKFGVHYIQGYKLHRPEQLITVNQNNFS